MADLKKYDRIVLTWDQLQQVEGWCRGRERTLELEDLYEKLPFTEGILEITGVNGDSEFSVVDIFSFNQSERCVVHDYFQTSKKEELHLLMIKAFYDRKMTYDIVHGGMDKETAYEMALQIIQGFYCAMRYITSYEKERVQISRTKIKTKPGKLGKVKYRKVITITGKIYEYDEPNDSNQKRLFNRITESWGVRGHWRSYKSGKRAWVKPHVKGHGDKEAKEYKLA